MLPQIQILILFIFKEWEFLNAKYHYKTAQDFHLFIRNACACSSWRKKESGWFFFQVFIPPYPHVRPTAVWAGAGYQLFIICSFLGKNQERFYCRIGLITLDLTIMERMSFNLTSFTSYLFTVDFSLIYLNQSWLLCFKCRGEVGQTSVSPYKTQYSSCFSRPCYQQTFLVPVIIQPALLVQCWKPISLHVLSVFQHFRAFPKGKLMVFKALMVGALFPGNRNNVCPQQTQHNSLQVDSPLKREGLNQIIVPFCAPGCPYFTAGYSRELQTVNSRFKMV